MDSNQDDRTSLQDPLARTQDDEDDIIVHPSNTIPAASSSSSSLTSTPNWSNPAHRAEQGRSSYDPDHEDETRAMLSEQQLLQGQRGLMDGKSSLARCIVHV